MNLVKKVRQLPVFAGIQREVVEEILGDGGCKVKTYEAQALIHWEGETCSSAEYILRGEVDVQLLKETGSMMTISTFKPGDVLGSNLIFSSHPVYPMMVSARSDVELLSLKAPTLLKLCTISPVFLESFLKEISDRALLLSGKITTIALKSLREAIMDYLDLECRLQNTQKINLPFSKKEWAERLGVQRPSLSRELSKMRDEGLIDYDRRTITLKRKE